MGKLEFFSRIEKPGCHDDSEVAPELFNSYLGLVCELLFETLMRNLLFVMVMCIGSFGGLAYASTECPNGNWVSADSCVECPDGNWYGGTSCVELPTGTWTGTDNGSATTECPDGNWVPNSSCIECPDGNWYGGTSCIELPNGTWTGSGN